MTTKRLLVIGSHNRDKAREIAASLGDLPLELRGLWEWPGVDPVEETGTTLAENAMIKAEAATEITGAWAMADDTGLEVDYLGGGPGIFSARYAGDGATYADNRNKLIRELDGVAPERRTARFRTVIALARPGYSCETIEGVVEGRILNREEGTEGFGYDPVFFFPPAECTFAQMTLEQKNAVSHRGRALEALRRRLMELLRQAQEAPR